DGDSLDAFDLSNLGARIYDPVIGRFLSRDPMLTARAATSSNPYAFAMNDPVNVTDPSGLNSCGPDGLCITASNDPDTPDATAAASVFGAAWAAWNFIGSQYGAHIQVPQIPNQILATSFNLAYELESADLERLSKEPSRLDCFTSSGGFKGCLKNATDATGQ